jgi:hypothetical protein
VCGAGGMYAPSHTTPASGGLGAHDICRAVFDLRARPACSSWSETPTVNLATAQNQYRKQGPNVRSPNRVSNTKVDVVLGTTVPNWEYTRQDVGQLSHASGHRAAGADQVWCFFFVTDSRSS